MIFEYADIKGTVVICNILKGVYSKVVYGGYDIFLYEYIIIIQKVFYYDQKIIM